MKNKKVLIIVGAIVVVLILVYVIALLSGGLNSSNGTVSSTTGITQDSGEGTQYGWSGENASTEEGTTERADEVLFKAMDDAKAATEDDAKNIWEDGFDYLKAHMNNFYESNEVMEKSMYYGEFIYQYIEENSTASDISELEDSTKAAYEAGYNTVKAIKYVYRGVDQIDDESTQNALAEAKEALEKFN